MMKTYNLRNRTVNTELFGHMTNILDNREGFDLKDSKDPPKTFLINFGNSCAPDSILYILFFFENGYFMDIIKNNPGDPEFDTEFRDEINDPLLYLYSGDWNVKINKIQTIISKFLETSCFSIKSGTEIWHNFSSSFSNLQFTVQTTRAEEIKNDPYLAAYLEPIEENNPDNITSDPNHLIYADDYNPKKRDLRNNGFAMDHGDYYLSGVLFFVNKGHYTAAVKGKDHWWYYDDLLSKRKILKNPESGIFEERPNKKAQILFYSKKIL